MHYNALQTSTNLRAATARDLTLDAAQAARSSRIGGSGVGRPMSTPAIKKLLDSRNEREVLEGLRRVVSVCCSDCRTSISVH